MNSLIPVAMAQAGGVSSTSQYGGLLIPIAFVAILYFMMIRPQQKKAKDHQAMLGKLASGDEVVTSGGILGRIVEVGDAFVTVEVADSVRVKVQKSQVTSLMPKGTLKSA
jgi:preprotein translocase subunit YajC